MNAMNIFIIYDEYESVGYIFSYIFHCPFCVVNIELDINIYINGSWMCIFECLFVKILWVYNSEHVNKLHKKREQIKKLALNDFFFGINNQFLKNINKFISKIHFLYEKKKSKIKN